MLGSWIFLGYSGYQQNTTLSSGSDPRMEVGLTIIEFSSLKGLSKITKKE